MNFEKITLEQIEQVKLMNRVDRKFWFRESNLPQILDSVLPAYYMLSIDNQSHIRYATVYYDTPDDAMHVAHHNGKLNRYKVRRRTYLDSGVTFLEVKFKNNKGRTIKRRLASGADSASFSEEEKQFIQSVTPYRHHELVSTVGNRFTRITLISKAMNERCTIDTDLRFLFRDQEVTFPGLVIAEIKMAGRSGTSPLGLALRDHRIKQSGFSKYCMGRIVTDPTVKQNVFKAKMRVINRIMLNQAS